MSRTAYIVYGDIGTATSYNPPYISTRCYGNRQDQFPPSKLFVAVDEGLSDNGAACGRRYKMRCLSGADRPHKHQIVDVKVVDFCSQIPCPSTTKLSLMPSQPFPTIMTKRSMLNTYKI
ncbi:EG45-like domain containing protein 2 [Citrus sinensis]|nr:EG45-like domain containing protein 2 [Citrus sinensis]